jgi:hypothetical protein
MTAIIIRHVSTISGSFSGSTHQLKVQNIDTIEHKIFLRLGCDVGCFVVFSDERH